MGNHQRPDKRKARPGETLRDYVDVAPRMGRALVFEQGGLWHSGEGVEQGTKLAIRTDIMYEVCPGSERMVDDGDGVAFE